MLWLESVSYTHLAKLNVNPTRMALSNLKGRLVTAKRGHKLLKDKQDELMRRFIEMIRKNKKLRLEVEEELSNSFKSFLLASAVMSPEFLEQAVAFPKEQVSVAIETKNAVSYTHLDVYKRQILKMWKYLL